MRNLIRFTALLLLTGSLLSESPFRENYIVTSEFHSKTGKGGERRNNLHQGIDLWCEDGIIFPALDGVVTSVNVDPVYGKSVTIWQEDQQFYTFYAHGATIFYSASGEVTTDTPIMRMGSTGYSSGPHLHFAVFKIVECERVWLDPEVAL